MPWVVEQLAAPIREFRIDGFALGRELARMEQVGRTGADEAVAFYGARILEGLARDAVGRIGAEPSENLFGNLSTLKEYGRLGPPSVYWAHALRRIGNQVRHLKTEITSTHARLSEALVESALQWYFCDFSHGCRLASLTVDQRPIQFATDQEIRAALEAVSRFEFCDRPTEKPAIQEILDLPGFLVTATIPAVLANTLINIGGKELVEARRVLDVGRAFFADDSWLLQLDALWHSRSNQLDRAIDLLKEPVRRGTNDSEAIGILAGAYKRRWERGGVVDDLRESVRLYRDGWRKLGEPYLGINAAAGMFWLGDVGAAERIANEVAASVERRMVKLDNRLPAKFLFWDRVTLAEAKLLLQNGPAAFALYRDAFVANASDEGSVISARRQIEKHLRRFRETGWTPWSVEQLGELGLSA